MFTKIGPYVFLCDDVLLLVACVALYLFFFISCMDVLTLTCTPFSRFLFFPFLFFCRMFFKYIQNIYLVNEYCSGGELYDRVVEKTQSKEGHFSEYSAARIIKNILSAIRYCHDDKHIVHRDLVRVLI